MLKFIFIFRRYWGERSQIINEKDRKVKKKVYGESTVQNQTTSNEKSTINGLLRWKYINLRGKTHWMVFELLWPWRLRWVIFILLPLKLHNSNVELIDSERSAINAFQTETMEGLQKSYFLILISLYIFCIFFF